MISVSDPLRVRFFLQSLTGPAFGWYTSLGPDSIRTWKQLEEQFHIQYHSEAAEAGIADCAGTTEAWRDRGGIHPTLQGGEELSHPVFKGQNRMHNYMYARIKFHTYSDFISE
jgi:hypothetical protein